MRGPSSSPRTSHTHPLQIAEVDAGPAMGRIGITFCPGEKQTSAFTGSWDRDLDLDCDAIRDWGAAAVVTLVEHHELATLQVTRLGAAVAERQMAWYHLPIQDVSVPCSRFEAHWSSAGAELGPLLRNGFSVLVHCKGGLGRAGMIATRLLIELGHEPQAAIAAVREVRPGAIETQGQVQHVLALRPKPEAEPSRSPGAIRDRAVGALLGLAAGDAVGTSLEFKARDSYPHLTDMVGGGPFGLQAGQWTDDTAMALALAETLADVGDTFEHDLMERFTAWMDRGEYSCTGRCFDIGLTVRGALSRWKREGNPLAGSTEANSAGNGSLMRLAPVAIRYWNDPGRLKHYAAQQSRTTHSAAEAVDACVAYAQVLAAAIAGDLPSQVLAPRETDFVPGIASILAGSWRGKPRHQIRASGYVVHSLEAALWSVGRTTSFAQAVLTAANLGEDADTTAAIAGQLAGALYGASAIPPAWREKLAWHNRIVGYAEALLPQDIRDAR